MPKTIVIADDHPFTRDGMARAVEAVDGLRVVGMAANGIEAIAAIKRHKPDCAVLDLSMPGANGLEVFQEAKTWSPHSRFVIITGVSAGSLFRQLVEAGIDGLFVKNTDARVITDGLLRVCAGERIISDDALQLIEQAGDHQDLSSRELDVLRSLSKGQTNREIAEEYGISPKTVDSHRTNLLRKMEVNSTAALLVKAMRIGLLDL